MKTKAVAILAFAVPFFFASCGGGTETPAQAEQSEVSTPSADESSDEDYDATAGLGKYNAENMAVTGLDVAMAGKGKSIADTKCMSCHKMTDEKLVGPGWKGVTERRTLHWLMNFITAPDEMIDKDPALQSQLEECLVRMPNQNLGDDNARSIVEYMRQNDGAK